jgi:hypothetical protein
LGNLYQSSKDSQIEITVLATACETRTVDFRRVEQTASHPEPAANFTGGGLIPFAPNKFAADSGEVLHGELGTK